MEIEIEPLAHDFERDVTAPAELDERGDGLVHRRRPACVLDEFLPPRADERELAGHRLPGADHPCAMEPLDLLPLPWGEARKEGLRDVGRRDRAVEIAEDGERPIHRRSPRGCPPPPPRCGR